MRVPKSAGTGKHAPRSDPQGAKFIFTIRSSAIISFASAPERLLQNVARLEAIIEQHKLQTEMAKTAPMQDASEVPSQQDTLTAAPNVSG
jgi:hypothetical protein